MNDRSVDREREWGLDELVAVAGDMLASADVVQRDGRVTSAPDVRSIRFYQQLGMVDPPMRYDGRRAVYGYRHLLQTLAIKRLQAVGLTLAQVQRALAGRSTIELEEALETGNGTRFREPEPLPPTTENDPAVAGARPLVAREIAKGVVVVVDPEHVRDPEHTIDKIRAALAAGHGSPGGHP